MSQQGRIVCPFCSAGFHCDIDTSEFLQSTRGPSYPHTVLLLLSMVDVTVKGMTQDNRLRFRGQRTRLGFG